MSEKVLIKEIFESIQGEGTYVGHKQVFIRFCRCNLSCQYCDTDFSKTEETQEYTPFLLKSKIAEFDNYHSIVLTGGEPLLETTFLKEFLPEIYDKKVFLETNGILYYNLMEIIEYIDIIAMDYKLPSATGHKSKHELHRKFIEVAKKNNKNIFLKVVFDSKITQEEISQVCDLAKEFPLCIVLQPMMSDDKFAVEPKVYMNIFDKFLELHNNVRLIPQIHKYLNVR